MLKNAIASNKMIASRKSANRGKTSRLKNFWGAVAQSDNLDRNTSFDVIGNYEGSSATDCVTDVTDVTDVTEVSQKEEGRRKKEEGKTKNEENIIIFI